MDGVITVILNIPIADLGTPKIVALLKQIEEFKKPDQQPLREESESERMKRKGLEAKLQILNEQFKDHGAAFQVEIPGESVNDLEKRVKKSMEWAQRKISEEAAKKSTSSKGKDEILEKSSQRETSLGPNGLVDPLIQAALQAVTDHIFSRVDTCFDIPKTQLNALEVFSITIVRNLFKKPNETSSPNKETRTFNADWLSDFGFTESQIKLINSSLSAALSAFNEDEMERLLKFNDAFLKCFVPTNASTINNYIKVLKAAFTDPTVINAIGPTKKIMDGTITVTVNIPIADLGTPKVVALLKHLEEFKTPNQQPLREELESDRMKRKVLEAKLQILNDQFKDHGAAFLVEIPGESIENLEKRVKQSVEWAQRKISEEEAQKSTSKGKSEAPESSGNSLIHAALQAAANHVASQINPQSSPQPCQSNTLNVNPSFASVATSLSSHVETFLQSVPKGRGLNQILKEQVVEAFLDSMFDEMCGDATHQSVNPRTFNANWLLDFDFSQSDVASINSSFNAVLSTVSEENKKTFLEMYDNILDCFLSSDDQMKKFLISLVKTAFKESNIQSQAKNTVDLLPKFLLGSEPPNQETIKKAVRVFFRTLKGFV